MTMNTAGRHTKSRPPRFSGELAPGPLRDRRPPTLILPRKGGGVAPPTTQGGGKRARGPRTTDHGPRTNRGITLTEVLISIMILGIGLVSLAALFPVGLSRLRDASRYSRSAYLSQSGATDVSARGLLKKQYFYMADGLNGVAGYPFWFVTPLYPTPLSAPQFPVYDPFTQDTQFYGGEAIDYSTNPWTFHGATCQFIWFDSNGGQHTVNTGTGLPIAYDPLWRHQTRVYLDPINQTMPEARFGAGTDANGPTFVGADPTDGGLPSAWGLQRLTNFNRPTYTNAFGATLPLFPADLAVPSIFVSPEDVVLQDPSGTNYTIDGITPANGGLPVIRPSPVLPELNSSPGTFTNDWRYSWMFTGQQTNVPAFSVGQSQTSLGATFDGNLIIFENRPFGISQVVSPLGPTTWQVTGETVVEAVWGYSTNVQPVGGPGYGSGADRTVLLRWPASMPDPVVKAGDWIADVTYERNQQLVLSRFLSWGGAIGANQPAGLPDPINNGEWDNLPAQRCFWYQVQRVTQPAAATGNLQFPSDAAPYRYMMVYINSTVQARTVLNAGGQPLHRDAALICPYVVNVIPQTFSTIAGQ
jgi:type II secretory pathway pseudopilin PulG